MLSLFEHWDGAAPLANMVRIGPERRPPGKAPFRTIYFADGTSVDALGSQIEDIQIRPMQLITAQPGISIVEVHFSEDGPPDIYREPVIAWALCADGEIRAVSPNGVNGSRGIDVSVYVEMPGSDAIQAVGQWADPCRFRSIDDMIDYHRPKRGDA